MIASLIASISDFVAGLFRSDHILFTVLGYRMSTLEFVGTILNLWSVLLAIRRDILTWLIGLFGTVWFGFLFYQVRLYSDVIVQVYFFATNLYGWWAWRQRKEGSSNRHEELAVGRSLPRENFLLSVVIAVASVGLGSFMSHVHLLLPAYFPNPAAYPYIDAWETVMSFIAQILLAHKKLESWYLWIAIDVISVALYAARGILFVALLYTLFLVMAIRGLLSWRSALSRNLRE